MKTINYEHKTPYDMEKKHKKFINIFKDTIDYFADERVYDFYAIAVENGKLSEYYYKTIEIEL